MEPKVFLCHSSKDKGRFVIRFAERLRDRGVKVWLDDWELRPGDSLIDRIFSEALDVSDIIIVVLSSNTVDSNWVKNELSAAALRRIEGKCKIIPVVLDDVDVPPVLRDTVYQKIPDFSSYDQEFQRILDGIHGQSNSLSIGEPPISTRDSADTIDDGLQAGSRFILKRMVALATDSEMRSFNSDDLEQIRQSGEISESLFSKEIRRLERDDHIEVHRYLGGGMSCRLNPSGTIIGLARLGTDVDEAWNQIAACIVNSAEDGSELSVLEIANETGQVAMLVDAFVAVWESRGHLKVTRAFGGHRATRIWWVDPLFEDELI